MYVSAGPLYASSCLPECTWLSPGAATTPNSQTLTGRPSSCTPRPRLCRTALCQRTRHYGSSSSSKPPVSTGHCVRKPRDAPHRQPLMLLFVRPSEGGPCQSSEPAHDGRGKAASAVSRPSPVGGSGDVCGVGGRRSRFDDPLAHPHTHGALRHRHPTPARPPSAKRSSITAPWPSSGHSLSDPHCVRKPIYSDSPLRPSTIHNVSLTPHCVTKPICYSPSLPPSAHAAAALSNPIACLLLPTSLSMSVKFLLDKMRRANVALGRTNKAPPRAAAGGSRTARAAFSHRSPRAPPTRRRRAVRAASMFQDCRGRGGAMCEVCSAKKEVGEEIVREAAKKRQEFDFYAQGTVLHFPSMDEPTIGRTPHFSNFAKVRPINPPNPPHTASSTSVPFMRRAACQRVLDIRCIRRSLHPQLTDGERFGRPHLSSLPRAPRVMFFGPLVVGATKTRQFPPLRGLTVAVFAVDQRLRGQLFDQPGDATTAAEAVSTLSKEAALQGLHQQRSTSAQPVGNEADTFTLHSLPHVTTTTTVTTIFNT
ncbi:unnamed protein product [Vitrella brassicaformis CCMP3155]|uniref:Uncharacterized protein n=1 Tax=Vitrella brassicaformis (strain CCMP3155) TaxID=1169540 RepID=A0A0G4EU65_VITBC|nr:unnamed protein product [Vitrella brassicaformis CCMP3155]|eukprot:CEM01952.1 unnamed protein product [Vitrella brassicaformis CCMP3155]